MKPVQALTLIALLVALFAIAPVFAAPVASVPEVGQQAPNFTLPSQDGSNISLKDFRGKWVVLYFYPKDNTPGCTIEAHGFQADLPQYEKHNAVIVGVSVDTTDSHKDFCAKQGLTFKLLSDTDKKVVDQYGSVQTFGTNTVAARNTFLIDPQGKIVKEWIKVNPQGHSKEVLDALNMVK